MQFVDEKKQVFPKANLKANEKNVSRGGEYDGQWQMLQKNDSNYVQNLFTMYVNLEVIGKLLKSSIEWWSAYQIEWTQEWLCGSGKNDKESEH